MAWPFQKESDGSYQDMTVFGFGRKGYKELVEHVPDLKRLPARYTIAFVDRADVATARAASARLRVADGNGAPEAGGRFLRVHWFERSRQNGGPSFAHNRRFRVNAPDFVTHPTFAARDEARGDYMRQILTKESLRKTTD